LGLADGIRKHGFRAWHERELLLSFAWMALLVLCGVAAFAALEALFNSRELLDMMLSVLVITASGAIGVVALQRFLSGLIRAQTASSQAVCAQCETFGRLTVVAEDRDDTWVRVRCGGCAYEWLMDLAREPPPPQERSK
jgi:hypothetical protein